jgi:large subunit ribosomal protein L21
VRSGGKQYRVEVGSKIDVERLTAAEGERVELAEVLFLVDDGRMTVGSPTVPGAKVVAEVVTQGRSPKVTVFKYKAKVRYRKRTGHRQPYTRLAIQEIVTAEKKAAAKKARPKAEAEAEAEPVEAKAESKPKRAPRRKASSDGP